MGVTFGGKRIYPVTTKEMRNDEKTTQNEKQNEAT